MKLSEEAKKARAENKEKAAEYNRRYWEKKAQESEDKTP